MKPEVDLLSLPSLPLADKAQLPDIFAIYFVLDGDRVLYIGKTINLRERWTTHHRLKQFKKMTVPVRIAWIECSDATLLTSIEAALIEHFQPLLNQTKYEQTKPKVTAYVLGAMSAVIDSEAAKEWRSKSQMIELLLKEALEARGYDFTQESGQNDESEQT